MTGFDTRNAMKLATRLLAKAAEERAKGGRVRLLQDEYPSKYMPGVGRQVMRDGGPPCPVGLAQQDLQTPSPAPMPKPAMHRDPQTKTIEDWQWRPLEDVQQQLQLTEIPSHVAAFGSFMDETANKAGTQGLTPRDLIKAFTITRASIQRRAVNDDRLRQAGLQLPDDVQGMVRPEGAFGHWLHTDMGQRYLKGAEQGMVDPEAVRNAVQVMAPFGKHEKDIPDALIWAAKNLPGREAEISRLVAAAQQMESSPEEWREMARQFRGIGPSKSGFVASVMGRGDQPTLDARQLILHTGQPTSEAQRFLRRKSGQGATEAVERLADRQRAMGLETPSGMEPYYQHLTHHAVWDKAADEQTTHQDVMDAMRHAADGGRIEGDEPDLSAHPVAQALSAAGAPGIPQAKPATQPVKYRTWDDVPTVNPQNLVGKKIFPIFADLTKAGAAFHGIDASKLDQPEQLYGGPGYPLLPEVQEHGLAWAVEGKGRGTSKLLKDADYVAVAAMEPISHQSNASFANSLMKNMAAYVRDQRLAPEGLAQINDMIRAPSAQKELKGLESFPGFEHPDAEKFLRGMTFEQRKRVAQVLGSKAAQELGAPNLAKVTRSTLDPEFAGVPSRHSMFLMEIPRTRGGEIDEEELSRLLVHLKDEGLPEHPSYQYGIRGNLVGKFHTPVAPEVLFKDWFDKARADAAQKEARGEKTNVRRAFDLAMPVVTVSQDVANMLPHRPRDIQSGKAAQLALNAFNDRWDTTESSVKQGGLSPAMLSQALKDSESSSTLSQYSPKELQDMMKSGQFTGYKLKGGEVYFGLKRGTDYAKEYGFEHPELTPNETALVSVVNNETGAKGIGGAPVVLKAIQHGATALDCYAVPSAQYPKGFLPKFYEKFGFKELGRIPFDPKYVSPQQFEDMKHEWTKAGWDESMGLPSLSIMKWKGNEDDRQDAVRRYLGQSSADSRVGRDQSDVRSSSRAAEQGVGQVVGGSQRQRGVGDEGGDRGGVRDDRAARPSDRFSRTLAEIGEMTPEEARHYGISPEEHALAKQRGLKRGGAAKGDDFGSHPAHGIPGIHIVGHNPVFTGER